VESGGPSVGKVWQCDVASRHLQGCSPHLHRLRTNGLAPVSKYWMYRSHTGDMGPISQVACCRQMSDFLHCFIGWLGRETRYGPTDQTIGVLWIVSGVIFWSSDSVQLYWWLAKCCYMWTTCDTYGRGPYVYRAWKACGVLVRFPLKGVHQFESPRLSDMSKCLFMAVFT
jgi:hypothetical protein